MSAFAHVVVGFDGSKSAQNALLWAADRTRDPASIEVVSVGPPHPDLPEGTDVQSVHRREGSPAAALMAVADERGADAIVIGPHGSGLGRGLGAVAKELLRAARVPVIVVEDAEPPRSIGSAPPVVACVGYGAAATSASQWAADFAIERSLPLVLLHSVAYRPIFPVASASDVLASYLGTGVSVSWARDELAAMAAELKESRPDLSVSTHVDCTSVIKAVRNAGETAELVVLGKRGDEEFMHKIGTPRLRRLVARSRFPTAVVPTALDAR